MKIRTGFVTNSSSSGFIVIQVIRKDGKRLEEYEDEENLLGDWDDEEHLEKIQEELGEAVSQIQSVQDLCKWLNDFISSELCGGSFDLECWEITNTKSIQKTLGKTLDSLAAVRVIYGERSFGEDVDQDAEEDIAECFGISGLSDLTDSDEEECYVTDYTQGVEILVDFTKKTPKVRADEGFFSLDLANGISVERLEDGKLRVDGKGKSAVLPEEEIQEFLENILDGQD